MPKPIDGTEAPYVGPPQNPLPRQQATGSGQKPPVSSGREKPPIAIIDNIIGPDLSPTAVLLAFAKDDKIS